MLKITWKDWLPTKGIDRVLHSDMGKQPAERGAELERAYANYKESLSAVDPSPRLYAQT